MKRITKRLRVKLSAAEKEAKSELLAKLCFDLGELEEKKKAAAADYSAQIKKLKADNSNVAYDVRTGSEEREVECREYPLWGEGVVEIRRLDTHDVVMRRPLTPEEKQTRFDRYIGDDDDKDDPNPRSH